MIFLNLAVSVLPAATLGVVEIGQKRPITILIDARKALDKNLQ